MSTTAGTTRTLRSVPVWAAAAGSATAALAVWFLAVPLTGVTLTVDQADGTSTTVGPAAVAAAAVAAVLLAWPVRAVLARSPRGPRVLAWRLTCAIVLLVSFTGPLGATSPAGAWVLAGMHLAVGAVVTVGLDPRRAAVPQVRSGR